MRIMRAFLGGSGLSNSGLGKSKCAKNRLIANGLALACLKPVAIARVFAVVQAATKIGVLEICFDETCASEDFYVPRDCGLGAVKMLCEGFDCDALFAWVRFDLLGEKFCRRAQFFEDFDA